jgi:hypothetical protein
MEPWMNNGSELLCQNANLAPESATLETHVSQDSGWQQASSCKPGGTASGL